MVEPPPQPPDRDLVFIGSSRRDLKDFPEETRREAGTALLAAQYGRKALKAKPLTGHSAFSGASVLEIVENAAGNTTYRVVYTVQFDGVVYVLHAFQKKAKKGIATPQTDIDLIVRRLKEARMHHATHFPRQDTG